MAVEIIPQRHERGAVERRRRGAARITQHERSRPTQGGIDLLPVGQKVIESGDEGRSAGDRHKRVRVEGYMVE